MSKKIHFIGIGGIGMSGLARLYLHEGATVSGSDREDKQLLRDLESEGVTIYRSHTPEQVPEDADLIVYSDGVPADNVERVRATELNIPQQQYFEALGEVANQYYLIAVAGTHGKTTTTAMLTDILEEASFDPTAIVGSLRGKTGSNFRAGKSKYFVVEADEYRNHFHFLNPDVLVVTNVEFDHPDYFTDLTHVQETFHALATRVPETGTIITDTTLVAVQPILREVTASVIDYRSCLDPMLALPQPGVYNQLNAAAAKATALQLGVEERHIATALVNFAGTKRRFEYKGTCNGALVFDDYAHHPSEIAAVITGARERYADKTLVVVFQPHTYSRTKELKSAFVQALEKADITILVPIYAARESDDGSVSSALIAEEVGGEYADDLAAAAEMVRERVDADHVVLVLGAGDVTKIGDLLV